LVSGNGHLDVVHLLAKHGANLNRTDNTGATPAHMAAKQGHVDVLRLLQVRNARLHDPKLDGQTSLHLAAFGGYVSAVGFLARHGADLARLHGGGRTALDEARRAGHGNEVATALEAAETEVADSSPGSTWATRTTVRRPVGTPWSGPPRHAAMDLDGSPSPGVGGSPGQKRDASAAGADSAAAAAAAAAAGGKPPLAPDESPSGKRNRGGYRCSKCGQPKRGHVCTVQEKLKRKEPSKPSNSVGCQAEVDPAMTVRLLHPLWWESYDRSGPGWGGAPVAVGAAAAAAAVREAAEGGGGGAGMDLTL